MRLRRLVGMSAVFFAMFGIVLAAEVDNQKCNTLQAENFCSETYPCCQDVINGVGYWVAPTAAGHKCIEGTDKCDKGAWGVFCTGFSYSDNKCKNWVGSMGGRCGSGVSTCKVTPN